MIFYGAWIPTAHSTISQPEPTIAATNAITRAVLMFVGEKGALIPPGKRRQLANALRMAHVEPS